MLWSSIIDLYDFYKNSLPFEICFLSILFGSFILGIVSGQYFDTLLVWVGLETSAIFGFGIHRSFSLSLFLTVVREINRSVDSLWEVLQFRHTPKSKPQLQILNVFRYIMLTEISKHGHAQLFSETKGATPDGIYSWCYNIPDNECIGLFLFYKTSLIEKIRIIQNPVLLQKLLEKYLHLGMNDDDAILTPSLMHCNFLKDRNFDIITSYYGKFNNHSDMENLDIDVTGVLSLRAYFQLEYNTLTDADKYYIIDKLKAEKFPPIYEAKLKEYIFHTTKNTFMLRGIKQKLYGEGVYESLTWKATFECILKDANSQWLCLGDFI